MEPKRYTLSEIGQHIGAGGDWFPIADDLRTRFLNELRLVGMSSRQVFGWNFDTYVTDPDFIRIGDNCITFVEQDTDRDVYETDLPYAVADGTMTADEWIAVALAEERAKFKQRERERLAREEARWAAQVESEKATLRRLAKKYPAVLAVVGSEEGETP